MANSARPSLVVDQLLHPTERDRFVGLCVETTCDELSQQLPRIAEYLDSVEARAKDNVMTDTETAVRVANALTELVQTDCENPQLTAPGRALLRGAIEYFVLTGDNQDDLGELLGFDDDVRVVNAVSQVLHRPDLHIDLI